MELSRFLDARASDLAADMMSEATRRARGRLLMTAFTALLVFRFGLTIDGAVVGGLRFERTDPQLIQLLLVLACAALSLEFGVGVVGDLNRYLAPALSRREEGLESKDENVVEVATRRGRNSVVFVVTVVRGLFDVVLPAIVVAWALGEYVLLRCR